MYQNPLGFLRSSKDFSTVMIISEEILRGMKILEGPRKKNKI